MPYKNIIYTKLKCELAADERFTDRLNDEQKLVYFCILLLAGVKENRVPDDENYIKRVLNLQIKAEKLRENLDIVVKTFPKLTTYNGYLKLRNYNKLHNPIRVAEVTPKARQRHTQIIHIIEEYIREKKYIEENISSAENKEYFSYLIKRYYRPAKQLLALSKNNPKQVIEAMHWFGGICDKKDLSWTLETILRWFPDFLVKGKTNSYDSLLKKFHLKNE